MVPSTKANSFKILSKGKANTTGQMEEYILEAGSRTKCMDRGQLCGLMAKFSKEAMKRT